MKVVGGTEAMAAGGRAGGRTGGGGRIVAGQGAGMQNAGGAGLAMRGCPKCGQRALIRQEGCDICTGCTYSKCG